MESTKNKKGINNDKNNNKKRTKEREKGTAHRERVVWGVGGGGREARSYMQKKTNESKPEDLSTTNA